MAEWTKADIAELRERLGLNQKEFAEAVGVTDVYVSYLERGTKTPSKTLCIVFDCLKKEEDRKGKGARHGTVHNG